MRTGSIGLALTHEDGYVNDNLLMMMNYDLFWQTSTGEFQI
jgi:hypothetical protein